MSVRVIEGVASLMERLQGMQVRATAFLDEVRGGSRGVVAELMLALSVTKNHVDSVVSVTRLPLTLALLESGKLDWYRASKVVEATVWLSDEDAAVVDAALASRLVGKNPTQVRKAANHAAAKADPKGADRRTTTRRAGRRLTLIHQEVGTADLSVDDAPAEKAVAAYRRIDRVARALKTRDEVRTLDQLRADVAMDLLLGGTSGRGGVQAEVFLYMDMNTYFGLNNDPVEMAGHGHLPAGVPPKLSEVVAQLLLPDPDRRPPGAAWVAERLAELIPGASPASAVVFPPVAWPGAEEASLPVGLAETIPPSMPEPGLPRRSPRPRRFLPLAGAGVACLAVGASVVLYLDGDSPPVVPPAPAPAPPAMQVVVAPPLDLGTQVALSWSTSRLMDYAVVVAPEGEPNHVVLAQRVTTMKVPVDPLRRYCFEVQATEGGEVYTSPAVSVRGARCG